MFCRNCGNELLDDAVFCNNCGTKVEIIKKENIHPVYEGVKQSFGAEDVRKNGKTKTVSAGKIAVCLGVICLIAATIAGAVFLIKANKRKSMREFPWLGIRMDLPEYWDSVIYPEEDGSMNPVYPRELVFSPQKIQNVYEIRRIKGSFFMMAGETSDENNKILSIIIDIFLYGRMPIEYDIDAFIPEKYDMEPNYFIEKLENILDKRQVEIRGRNYEVFDLVEISDVYKFSSDNKKVEWIHFKYNWGTMFTAFCWIGFDGEHIYGVRMTVNNEQSEYITEMETALKSMEYDSKLLASDDYFESVMNENIEIYKKPEESDKADEE